MAIFKEWFVFLYPYCIVAMLFMFVGWLRGYWDRSAEGRGR